MRHLSNVRICPSCHRAFLDTPAHAEGWTVSLDGKVKRGEREIRVTVQQAALLHMIAAAAPNPVHRDSLRSLINRRSHPNLVTVQVHKARETLAGAFGAHPIETIHGFGYRWRA